jgi:hypothetical protein
MLATGARGIADRVAGLRTRRAGRTHSTSRARAPAAAGCNTGSPCARPARCRAGPGTAAGLTRAYTRIPCVSASSAAGGVRAVVVTAERARADQCNRE